MTDAQPNERKRPRHTRVFSSALALSVVAAITVFMLGVAAWDTNIGVVVSAAASGLASGFVWWLVTRLTSGQSLESSVDGISLLGAIPVDASGPAPVLHSAMAADAYTGLLGEIESRTTGQILLISSPGPGQGATTVALNLSIAAGKGGRRVMLVDADASPQGLSRFLSTGRSPGLSDVAAGTATLADATRMWTLEDGTRFPMLPSGADLSDVDDLAGGRLADALDAVAERADLIVIDVPPVLWSSTTTQLAAHADGTILVLTDTADPATVTAAISGLADAGAPVLGYVRNRSTGVRRLTPVWWRRAVLHAVATSMLLLTAFGAYTGAQLWYSWNRLETEAFDTSAVADPNPPAAVSSGDTELPPGDPPPAETPRTTAPEQAYETILIIGRDEVSGAADVILYLVRPTNSADPFMVSLPRDLYVENACTGGMSRINVLIHGCANKDINGPSLLAHTVGQFTGIEVDHFVLFDFDGFERVVDAVGGVEICVDYPVSDRQAGLSLPAGCTKASGEQALAWVRSRHTQQKIGGSWKSVPGASDLLRNQHQQDVIIELFKELKSFSSPTELTAQVASLADVFTLDNTLSLPAAVSLAWELRDFDLSDVKRLKIPVRLTRTKSGQSILVATMSFDEVLVEAYGGRLPTEHSGVQESAAMAE
ncbi:MAG: LCP family protein [Actinomycetota bacterium]|nr:LCP family protein [Actinomycetota bacterium]MDK1096524.1 LCP family protein [Actinomycetota bacterium]MDK1291205.1 LCP family protein [Actinomycetota bacterium]